MENGPLYTCRRVNDIANTVTARNQSDYSKTESARYITSETCYITSESDIDIVQKHIFINPDPNILITAFPSVTILLTSAL